jgi:tetratricopeptide (TPR) repeat protein
MTDHDAPNSKKEAFENERSLALMQAEQLLEFGNLEIEQSDHEQALLCYREALETYRTHHDQNGEARAMSAIANVYRSQGLFDQAIKLFEQSIEVFKRVGDKRKQASSLGNLAVIYLTQGQKGRALELFGQAITIHRDVGNKRSEGITIGNMGALYQTDGQHEQAIEHFDRANRILQEVGDMVNQGSCLGNMGDALFNIGRYDEAESALRKAINICDDTFPMAAGAFRGSLALMLAQQGRLDETSKLFQAGEPQVAPRPDEYAKFICKKGLVSHMNGAIEETQEALRAAKKLAAQLQTDDDSEVNQLIAKLQATVEPEA